MENATKALLMAGGMLLVMLVIALVIYAWGIFSEYYSSSDDLADIEDLTEFNLQFTSYDRDNVAGYELISLANKVADYNQKYSTEGKNDENYSPVTLVIYFTNESNEDKRTNLTYDNTVRLFTDNPITQSSTVNKISKLITDMQSLETTWGGSEIASNIAKSVSSLDYDTVKKNNADLSDSQIKELILANFNVITGKNYTNYSEVQSALSNSVILKYYEYYQFKKGIFSCGSIDYDSVTGRVSKITFNFTGKVK